MAARSEHVFQLCFSVEMKTVCAPYFSLALAVSWALVSLEGAVMCSQSSLILGIGCCGLCPVGSKPGLEHLDSVGVSLEFCSTLSSSPGSFLPPLR